MSTMRVLKEEANKDIQGMNSSNITETNLLIYVTAAAMHRRLHPVKNTERIVRNTPP